MKNKIQDLRNHLFATIEGLLDPDSPMDLERAKTVADVAQVIVNSAKVEVDMVKAIADVGSAVGKPVGSGFIPLIEGPR